MGNCDKPYRYKVVKITGTTLYFCPRHFREYVQGISMDFDAKLDLLNIYVLRDSRLRVYGRLTGPGKLVRK
ncbi:MAG: hypothetical protein QXY50_02770 [Candidatus Caldarchaeum sp.]